MSFSPVTTLLSSRNGVGVFISSLFLFIGGAKHPSICQECQNYQPAISLSAQKKPPTNLSNIQNKMPGWFKQCLRHSSVSPNAGASLCWLLNSPHCFSGSLFPFPLSHALFILMFTGFLPSCAWSIKHTWCLLPHLCSHSSCSWSQTVSPCWADETA